MPDVGVLVFECLLIFLGFIALAVKYIQMKLKMQKKV
jgi:hypothetical protein